MTLSRVRTRLASESEALRMHFGVSQLFLFGSVVRKQATPRSDIDLAVEFLAPPTLDRLLDLGDYLEALLGAKVDLVTLSSIRPRVLERIRPEMIRIA